jgi:hypothetical protein
MIASNLNFEVLPMFSKIFLAFLVTFLISSYLFAMPKSYDLSVQNNARRSFLVSANEVGEYNWGNCYSRFPRDLRVYESRNVLLAPWAVFSGGVKVGSSWMDDYGGGTCQGLYGYATVKEWLYSSSTQMSDTITVSFAPKKPNFVGIVGKPLKDYIITINNSFSRTYRSPAGSEFYRYQHTKAYLGDIGFTPAQLSNVTAISIKAVDPDWAFAVNGIGLSSLDAGTGIEPPGVSGSELRKPGGVNEIKWLPTSLATFVFDLYSLRNPTDGDGVYASGVFRGERSQFGGLHRDSSYQLLLSFLTSNIGREYLSTIPQQRTFEGCDMSQNSDVETLKPYLFTFPYDW